MKNTLYKVVLLLFIISSLSSCSKSKALSAIPKDSDFVASVSVYSLIKKADLGELKDLKMMKTLNKELKSESKKGAKIIKSLQENPFITGVDFLKDFFVFHTKPNDNTEFTAVAASLKNASKFTDFIQKSLSDLEIDYELISKENYRYINLEDDRAIAWDDNKLIFIGGLNRESRNNLMEEITRIFSLSKGNQIMANTAFASFYKNKKDISVFTSTNVLENTREFNQLEQNSDYNLKDNYVKMHLDFQEEEINLKTNLALNKSLKKALKEYQIWDNTFNKKLLNYMPKQHLAVTSVAINPMAYYKYIKTQRGFDRAIKSFEKKFHIKAVDFFNNIGGSAVINWSDYKKQVIKYKKYDYFSGERTTETREDFVAVVSLALDIKDVTLAKQFVSQLEDEGVATHDGYYTFYFDDKFPTHFAFNDKIIFFSNDKAAVQSFATGKKLKENLTDTDLKSDIKDSYLFASLILDTDQYPYEITNDNFLLRGEKAQTALREWNAFANSLDFKQTTTDSAELMLKLKDGKNNSLNRLIRTADGIYSALMN
jgi:hypothetical protein